jgi:hypothetical protein
MLPGDIIADVTGTEKYEETSAPLFSSFRSETL